MLVCPSISLPGTHRGLALTRVEECGREGRRGLLPACPGCLEESQPRNLRREGGKEDSLGTAVPRGPTETLQEIGTRLRILL